MPRPPYQNRALVSRIRHYDAIQSFDWRNKCGYHLLLQNEQRSATIVSSVARFRLHFLAILQLQLKLAWYSRLTFDTLQLTSRINYQPGWHNVSFIIALNEPGNQQAFLILLLLGRIKYKNCSFPISAVCSL